MKLWLITLGHEFEEGTVISPIVVPADSFEEAERLQSRISDEVGIPPWDEPVEVGEF